MILMWFAQIIAGVAVLVLGVAVIFFSTQLSYKSEYGPGPGFLPFWLGIAIIGCAIYVITHTLKKYEKTGMFFKPRTKIAVNVLILIVIAFLLLPLFGFSVGLGLYVGATMRVIGKHHWISCVLTTIVTAIAIHFIFGHWLGIPLPMGMIGW
jgi:putative tricarboxylic transport membrane protein